MHSDIVAGTLVWCAGDTRADWTWAVVEKVSQGGALFEFAGAVHLSFDGKYVEREGLGR